MTETLVQAPARSVHFQLGRTEAVTGSRTVSSPGFAVTAPTSETLLIPRAYWGGGGDLRVCEVVGYHAPTPSMVEYHHGHPVYLQNRLYGRIVDGADTWACSNCHDTMHAWIYFLMGQRHTRPTHGGNAKARAVVTVEWFNAEAKRLGLAA